MRNAFFIGLAALLTAMLNCGTASAQSLYFSDVVNTSCLSTTSCTFTFPAVASTNGNGILTVSKLSCRIVAASGIVYAALGKSTNSTKLEFLQHLEYTAGSNGSTLYIASVINTSTVFFVQAGTSPTITITTGSPIVAPNSTLDQPTCSVAGVVQ